MCHGDVSADTLFRGRSTLEVSGVCHGDVSPDTFLRCAVPWRCRDTLEVSGTPEVSRDKVSRDTLEVIDTLEVGMRRKGEAKNGQIDNF